MSCNVKLSSKIQTSLFGGYHKKKVSDMELLKKKTVDQTNIFFLFRAIKCLISV